MKRICNPLSNHSRHRALMETLTEASESSYTGLLGEDQAFSNRKFNGPANLQRPLESSTSTFDSLHKFGKVFDKDSKLVLCSNQF